MKIKDLKPLLAVDCDVEIVDSARRIPEHKVYHGRVKDIQRLNVLDDFEVEEIDIRYDNDCFVLFVK